MTNKMLDIKIEKVTLNIGTGKDQVALEKAQKLLNVISGTKSIRTVTQKRIAAWGLRPGLPIGVKVTLRKEKAKEIISKLLYGRDNKLAENNFDENGNISFGLRDYIDIKDAKYDPEIGSMGLQCAITLERAGFRVKKRKYLNRPIPQHHRISKKDSIAFMKQNFKIVMDEEANEDGE